MGCDIHAYVEFRERGRKNWWSFSGRLSLSRNYYLFGALAGVRDFAHEFTPNLRGVPSDMASYARDDYWTWIEYERQPGDDGVSPEQARQWVERGWSTYDGEVRVTRTDSYSGGTVLTFGADGSISGEPMETRHEVHVSGAAHDGAPRWVSSPDWHSATWLSSAEWKCAIEAVPQHAPEYDAVTAALDALVQKNCEARVVIWFDN